MAREVDLKMGTIETFRDQSAPLLLRPRANDGIRARNFSNFSRIIGAGLDRIRFGQIASRFATPLVARFPAVRWAHKAGKAGNFVESNANSVIWVALTTGDVAQPVARARNGSRQLAPTGKQDLC